MPSSVRCTGEGRQSDHKSCLVQHQADSVQRRVKEHGDDYERCAPSAVAECAPSEAFALDQTRSGSIRLAQSGKWFSGSQPTFASIGSHPIQPHHFVSSPFFDHTEAHSARSVGCQTLQFYTELPCRAQNRRRFLWTLWPCFVGSTGDRSVMQC